MRRAFPSAELRLLCLTLAIAAPSLADSAMARNVESVTVETQNALPGIWRFPPHERRSDWSQQGSDVVVRFDAMGPEKYCRIGRSDFGYNLNCLEIAERLPLARLSGSGQVQLSWTVLFGVPGCRWTFRGQLLSSTEMSGRLGMACGMVLREKAQPMTVTKLVLSEGTPDAGGQAPYLRHLLEQVAARRISEPYTKPHFVSSNPDVVPLPAGVQDELMVFPSPLTLRLLGKVTAIVYVAEYSPIAGWWYKQASPVYSEKRSSIYAIEFENGERLYALHRRPDGVLDLFQCV